MKPGTLTFTAIALVALALTGVGIYTVHRLAALPAEEAGRAGAALEGIAAAFRTGTVRLEFRDYVTRTRGTQYLQVAALESVDTFTRTDSTAIFWDRLQLPDVVVQLETPVTYTYYLDLDEPWTFTWEGNRQSIRVDAPALRWNTPAVNLAELELRIVTGSILRDEAAVMERLKRQMPDLLDRMARDKAPLVRELARRSARRFVENWLVEVRFRDAPVKPHVEDVYFADESPTPAAPAGGTPAAISKEPMPARETR
jgi:hypothetical protein